MKADPDISKLPLGPGVRILKKDPSGLIAFEKPCGVRSHPNHTDVDLKALLKAPYVSSENCFKVGEGAALYLLHRLDAPTSGILLGTFDKELSRVIQKCFQDQAVEKTYYALVKGKPIKTKGSWNTALEKNKQADYVRMHRGTTFKALTHYECLNSYVAKTGTVSLLALKPITGKTHQLRIHCAHHRVPIVGDQTYGDFKFNRLFEHAYGADRLFLHAHTIEIKFTYQNKDYTFKAVSEIPEAFNVCIAS